MIIILHAEIQETWDCGFEVKWRAEGFGFGLLTFNLKNGRLICDNEGMSREFIKRVLNYIVDQCELVD